MDVVTNQGRTTRWLRGALGGALLASGMTALAAPPQQRAAILLPPVKMEPGEIPTIARGAIDDVPVGSTPVVRKASTTGGPAWVSGVDPNVIPAAGFAPFRDKAETKTPILHNAKDLPPLTSNRLNASVPSPASPPKLLDKSKMAPANERMIPPLLSSPEQPAGDPSMPLRGTASNGAPVLAGPPAYRWYGYGTATPGANQYAPNGQYPKASANWYGVTGATPGAFPVPVVNPYRGTPGNEPPSYVANPPARTMEIQKNPVIAVPPSPPAPAVRPNPATRPAPAPQTGVPAMPPIGSIGTSTQPLPPLPTPVGVPVMPSVSPVNLTKPAPEPLPPTLRKDAPLPALPPPNLFSEPGANLIRNEITARAQMPDGTRTDATTSLIHGLCKGRADGVDVRWNSSRKLTVCFETRTAPDATKLVKDISARPELAPFAIDFCVLVK